MEEDVGVVSEDVKHGEEVNIVEEWAEDRSLGDTMSYGAGGGRVCVNPIYINVYLSTIYTYIIYSIYSIYIYI